MMIRIFIVCLIATGGFLPLSAQSDGAFTEFFSALKPRIETPLSRVGIVLDTARYDRDQMPLFDFWNRDFCFLPRRIALTGLPLVSDKNNPAQGVIPLFHPPSGTDQVSRTFWDSLEISALSADGEGHMRFLEPVEFRRAGLRQNNLLIAGQDPDTELPASLNQVRLFRMEAPADFPLAAHVSGSTANLFEKPGADTYLTDRKRVRWFFDPRAGTQPEERFTLDVVPPDGESHGIRQKIPLAATLVRFLRPEDSGFYVSLRMRTDRPCQALLRLYGMNFSVDMPGGNVWREVRFDLPRERLSASKELNPKMDLLFETPCRVNLSLLAIHREPGAPGALLPEWEDAFRLLKPGAIRIQSGGAGIPLEQFLRSSATQSEAGFLQFDAVRPGALRELLALAKRLDAVPWIVLNPYYTTAELRAIAEYLGAPPNIGAGGVRAQQGQLKPWTREFDRIFFELDMPSPRNPQEEETCRLLLEMVTRDLVRHPHVRSVAEIVAPHFRHSRPPADAQGDAARLIRLFEPTVFSQTYPEPGDAYQSRLLYMPLRVFPRLMARSRGEGREFSPAEALKQWKEVQSAPLKKNSNAALMVEFSPAYCAFPSWADRREQARILRSFPVALSVLDMLLAADQLGYRQMCFYKPGVSDAEFGSHTFSDGKLVPGFLWRLLSIRNHMLFGQVADCTGEKESTLSVNTPAWSVIFVEQNVPVPSLENLSVPLQNAMFFADSDGRAGAMLLNRSLTNRRSVRLVVPSVPRGTEVQVRIVTEQGITDDTTVFSEYPAVQFAMPPASLAFLLWKTPAPAESHP